MNKIHSLISFTEKRMLYLFRMKLIIFFSCSALINHSIEDLELKKNHSVSLDNRNEKDA